MRGLAVFLFTLILVPGFTAQSGFVKGYIVQLGGDTVRGEVKVNPKKEHDNYYKATFKDEKGIQKIYKPGKIKSYGFNDEHFVAFASDDEAIFYKALARGTVNLYKLMYEGLRMNKSVFEAEYYLEDTKNSKLILVKENKFKKQISEWMQDNPALVESFEDSKQFDPAKAAELINKYNAWKAAQ